MSLRARLLNQWLRRVEKPAMARAADPQIMRTRFERSARLLFHAPRGTQMQWSPLVYDQRQVRSLEVVSPAAPGPGAVLYLHGGGFVFGSPRTYAALGGQIAARTGLPVHLPDYRLAPEHPFPAATRDARTAWDALVASGVRPERIIVGGDSAGGALALGLLAGLLAEGAARPAGVFCFSPLTDMTFSGPSFRRNARAEVLLAAERAEEMAEMYLAGHPRNDPLVSPLFADFAGAPPLWLSVGDTEILHDDSRRLVERCRGAGVNVSVEARHDLPHVWPMFHNMLPEAHETLDNLGAWIRQRLVLPDES